MAKDATMDERAVGLQSLDERAPRARETGGISRARDVRSLKLRIRLLPLLTDTSEDYPTASLHLLTGGITVCLHYHTLILMNQLLIYTYKASFI